MRFLHYFGKFLISVGVGVLLFVSWTLWGTGIYTRGQQDAANEEFERAPVVEPLETPQPAGAPEGTVTLPETYQPEAGDPVFRLRAPAIDLNYMVVQGVGVEDLKKGPGHYPNCREGFAPPLCTEFEEIWPGEHGRVVISGHRTTYDAPFWDINKLEEGDEIITETKWGAFRYEVTGQEIVKPNSQAIVIDKQKAEIVLTTCNPRFSASERLIVYAELVGRA